MRVRTAAEAIARQERRKRLARARERQERERIRRRETDPEEFRQTVRLLVCAAAFAALVGAKVFTADHAAGLRTRLSDIMGRNMDVEAVFSAVGRTFAGEETGNGAAERMYQAVFEPETILPERQAEPGIERPESNAEHPDTQSDTVTADTRSDTVTADTQSDTTAADMQSGGLIPYHWTGRLWDGSALETLKSSLFGGNGQSGTPEESSGNPETDSETPESESNPATEDAENNPVTPESENNPVTENPESNPAAPDNETTEMSSDDVENLVYTKQNLPELVQMEQAILNFDYVSPVHGTLTSGFGYRYHPVEGDQRFHYGVDLAASKGTDIVSFADGIVTSVGESNSYGRYCTISHAGGFSTLYAHCERVTALAGSEIAMGAKIGEVGATGEATGPHLHFELRRDSVWLNPVYYVSG